jgi:hypothetical protein
MSFPTLSNTELVLIATLVVVAILIAAVLLLRKRRTAKLRTQFGDAEYTRAVEKSGNRKNAEAGLEGRSQRVDALPGAVSEADRLLGDVLSTRGYPVGDFEQRAADISVNHPLVLENYRAAHEIALRQMQGQANTEDLRRALVHYRTLFEELVSEPAISVSKAAS